LLNTIRVRLQLNSVTVRLLHEDIHTGNQSLSLIAAASDWKSAHLPYARTENVNSYCFSESTNTSRSTTIVSLPDVGREDLISVSYPGLRYRPERAETRSELCVPLVSSEEKLIPIGTMNFEARDFLPLWFHRQLLLATANIVQTEISIRQRRAQRNSVAAIQLASAFAVAESHTLQRDALTLTSIIENMAREGTTVADLDVVQLANSFRNRILDKGLLFQRSSESRSILDLHDLSREIIEEARNVHHGSEKKVTFMESVHYVEPGPWSVPIHSTLRQLLRLLLDEQWNTLRILSEQNNRSYQIGLFPRVPSRTGFRSIDIICNGPPVDKQLRSNLFWSQIDDPDRPGKGTSGLGLATLGFMLRNINVHPIAHEFPASQVLGGPYTWATGLWIELCVPIERSND